jgi:hypothetical protein
MPTSPSLPLVSRLVHEERIALAAHAEALDSKAGVILGFSGALVALTSSHSGRLMSSGRWMAAAAAVLALWAFVPRRVPAPSAIHARKLLDLDEGAAMERLIDAEVRMIQEENALVGKKILRIAFALVLLVVAIGLTALGGVVK